MTITKAEKLRKDFDKIRNGSEENILKVVTNFCYFFLRDEKSRPIKLTPMQQSMVVSCLKKKEGEQGVVIVAPRGSGKSFALSIAVTIWLYFYRSGEEVFILAPFIDQTKKIFSYVLGFFESAPEMSRLIRHIRFDNVPVLRLTDGSVLKPRSVSRTNKGQSVRGQHATFLVVDESPYIGDDIFISNVEPMTIRHKPPFVNIGTPFSKDNHFYRYLYDEAYGNFTRLFFTYKDALVKGDAYEPAYSEDFILQKKEQWASNPEQFDVEFNCKFLEQAGRFISYNSVKDKIFENYSLDRNTDGENYISVDFGRMKNSTVISCFEKIIDGGVSKVKLKDIEEIIPKEDALPYPAQRSRIIGMAKKYYVKKIIIDATGMGLGQFDDLKKELLGNEIVVVPFKFTTGGLNDKTQSYIDFREYLQQGRMIFPNPKFLVEAGQIKSARLVEKGMDQLFDLSYEIKNANMRIVCLPRRHDDFPDCWMMAGVKILPMPRQEGHVSVLPLKIFSSKRVDFEKNFKQWKEGYYE